jgi:hypothetical protein
MGLIASLGFVGAKGFDTVAPITKTLAKGLKAAGMDYAVRYLGALPKTEVEIITEAGMAIMPVTYGLKHGTVPGMTLGKTFGGSSVKHATSAGIVAGTTVWLDLEDCAGTAQDVIAFVNAWASEVQQGGFMPGLYVGAGALLTSSELYALKVVRYWHSLSRVTDRNGALAEPGCGWCMYQLYPSITVASVLVDVDYIQQDYRGRLPTWTKLAG